MLRLGSDPWIESTTTRADFTAPTFDTDFIFSPSNLSINAWRQWDRSLFCKNISIWWLAMPHTCLLGSWNTLMRMEQILVVSLYHCDKYCKGPTWKPSYRTSGLQAISVIKPSNTSFSLFSSSLILLIWKQCDHWGWHLCKWVFCFESLQSILPAPLSCRPV